MLMIPARNIMVPLILPCFTAQVEEEKIAFSNTDIEEQGERRSNPSSTDAATATINKEIPRTIRNRNSATLFFYVFELVS